MIPACALVLAALQAEPAALQAAQAAFARADYPQAESLGLAAAYPPHTGEALYLVGLARFRQGRAAPALEALEEAGRAADAPAPALWHYNKGSCLYELERYREAEAEYLDAAALDDKLQAVALVNAGFAALDGGAADRARSLAALARLVATGAAGPLVADLEARVASDAERAPSSVVAGDAPLARESLASAAPVAGRAPGWHGVARLGSGFDSDALQLGAFEMNDPLAAGSRTPSAFTGADLLLSWRSRPRDGLFGELTYGLNQLAYLAPEASDRSMQQHSLSASLEYAPLDFLHVGGNVGGQMVFTGLADFRGLQASASTGIWAAAEEGEFLATRVEVDYARKAGLSEFSYLSGDRVEAALAQQLRLPSVTFELAYRFRAELIGSPGDDSQRSRRGRFCHEGCAQYSFEPLAYTGNALAFSSRSALAERVFLELSAGFEWRDYQAFSRGGRKEQRYFAGGGVSYAYSRRLGFSLRYDMLIDRVSIGDAGSLQSSGGYQKDVVSFGTVLSW